MKDFNETLKSIIVEKIAFACYVPKGSGAPKHKARPFHGFVIAGESYSHTYTFSDGKSIYVKPNDLFYLPKDSNYTITAENTSDCYAINFDANFNLEPFTISLKNINEIKKGFIKASNYWHTDNQLSKIIAIRTIYDIIYNIICENEKTYLPSKKYQIIHPAIEIINNNYLSNDISIESLAKACNISEVYFRKIFLSKFGISPKDYIIEKRI